MESRTEDIIFTLIQRSKCYCSISQMRKLRSAHLSVQGRAPDSLKNSPEKTGQGVPGLSPSSSLPPCLGQVGRPHGAASGRAGHH